MAVSAAQDRRLSDFQRLELDLALDPSLFVSSPPVLLAGGTVIVPMQRGDVSFGEVRIRTGDSPPRMECGCLGMMPGQNLCSHACWLILQYGGDPGARMFFHPPVLWGAIRLAAETLMIEGVWRDRREIPKRCWWAPGASPPDEDDCPICFEAHASKACVRCVACRHFFHSACAERWEAACPMCRHPGLINPGQATATSP